MVLRKLPQATAVIAHTCKFKSFTVLRNHQIYARILSEFFLQCFILLLLNQNKSVVDYLQEEHFRSVINKHTQNVDIKRQNIFSESHTIMATMENWPQTIKKIV